MLKKENIKAVCSIDTYDNGVKICKNGNIRKVQINDMGDYGVKITGLVKGNFGFFHTVKLTLNSDYRNVIEGYDCNCYEFTISKGPCRHCAALALALAEDSDENFGFNLPSKRKKKEEKTEEAEAADASAETVCSEDANSIYQSKDKEIAEKVLTGEKEDICEDTVFSAVLFDDEKENEFEIMSQESNKEEPARSMEIMFGNELSQSDEISDYAQEKEKTETPFFWYPNDTTKVFHTNTGIIGTMGTGKTQFTKSLITQLIRQQKNNFDGYPLGILIFDYKGDYNNTKTDFINAVQAKVLKLHRIPFNPLSIFETKEYKPLLPVHTANTFKDTLAKAFRLGPKQQTVLYSCIMEAYEQMGILPNEPETWKKSAPTFDMVYDIYEKNENIVKNDSLAAVMQKIHAFQLFEPKPYSTAPLFDVLKGVVVIDLSGYDPDLQSLIVAITLDQFYSQMHASGSSATDGTLRQITKLILVDEADNFMREDFASLKKIMKEGREFGVGTILSTQFLDHFVTGEDNYSKYILTWIVHNVSDLKKSDIEYVFKTKSNSSDTSDIYQRIKSFDRFQSVVKVGNDQVHYIKDKPFFELIKEQ